MLDNLLKGNFIAAKPFEKLATDVTKFDMSVSHYTIEALDKATHWDELNKDSFTNIRIDYKNSGIGSNSCGSELKEGYRLAEKNIHFIFYIKRFLK